MLIEHVYTEKFGKIQIEQLVSFHLNISNMYSLTRRGCGHLYFLQTILVTICFIFHQKKVCTSSKYSIVFKS